MVMLYLISAASIFAFAGIAKLTATYSGTELNQQDAFLSFLNVKDVLYMASFVEFAVGVCIIMSIPRRPHVGVRLALWLSLLFVIYRIGVALSPPKPIGALSCRCFGSPGGILGKHSDSLALALLAYLLVAGVLCAIVSGPVRKHAF